MEAKKKKSDKGRVSMGVDALLKAKKISAPKSKSGILAVKAKLFKGK